MTTVTPAVATAWATTPATGATFNENLGFSATRTATLDFAYRLLWRRSTFALFGLVCCHDVLLGLASRGRWRVGLHGDEPCEVPLAIQWPEPAFRKAGRVFANNLPAILVAGLPSGSQSKMLARFGTQTMLWLCPVGEV